MMTESGACDWDRLRALLPREKLDRIASIQPPQRDIGNLVEEEQQSFSPVTAMPLLEEPEVSFDPGGIG
ncbi:hypothetical protein V6N13_109856 [Hibiscus sabdariffa]